MSDAVTSFHFILEGRSKICKHSFDREHLGWYLNLVFDLYLDFASKRVVSFDIWRRKGTMEALTFSTTLSDT